MNYYNEFDPKAAAWIRELIKEGHIPPGEVDERSITDVKPDDLAGFNQCHFFAGIAGWALALRLAGIRDDERLWTGSCPCQPFSTAGNQMGRADTRHLWPTFRRLINRCGPSVIFGEQVASKDGRTWLAGVCSDLEVMGYSPFAADLCAAGIGAPHIRQRLYWMGYPTEERRRERAGQHGEIQGSRGRESQFAFSSIACGLAHSDGGKSWNGRLQSCGQHGQQPEDGSARRLADMHGERCAERTERDGEQNGPGQQASRRNDALRCSDADGLADMRGAGLAQRSEQPIREERQAIERGRDAVGLEHSALPQGARFGPLGEQLHRPTTWNNFDIVHCADGKARRVESGVQPLAHGVSGRVGLLRGYGNAIVPELAAQFIQACAEAIRDCGR